MAADGNAPLKPYMTIWARLEDGASLYIYVSTGTGQPRWCLRHCHKSRWAGGLDIVNVPPAYGVCSFCTTLPPPPPSRLYCHATATIAASTPVSLRFSHASGWLLHRHLSCRTSASLVVPPPLLLCGRLSCGTSLAPAGCRFANYLDVPPSLLLHWLVVALPPLSLPLCLSLSLHHLSHCATVSLGHRPSQPQ